MPGLPVLKELSPPSLPLLGAAFKASQFNTFVERDDLVWACNTRSGAFARLTTEQFLTVRRFLAGERPGDAESDASRLIDDLIRGQFLIPRELDEMKLLKVRNNLTRFSAGGLGLVIAPTLRCNFNCPYCYVDLNANKMAKEARDRVKKFFHSKLRDDSKASICWAGGNPSLAMDVVEELSASFLSSCNEKNSDYEAAQWSHPLIGGWAELWGERHALAPCHSLKSRSIHHSSSMTLTSPCWKFART